MTKLNFKTSVLMPMVLAQILTLVLFAITIDLVLSEQSVKTDRFLLETILKTSQQSLVRQSRSETNQILASLAKPEQFFRIRGKGGFETIWPKDYYATVWNEKPDSTVEIDFGEGQVFWAEVWDRSPRTGQSLLLPVTLTMLILTGLSFCVSLLYAHRWGADIHVVSNVIANTVDAKVARERIHFRIFSEILDVSASQKRLMFERQRRHVSEEAQNRVALVSARVAHDIRGPLSAIRIGLDHLPAGEGSNLIRAASSRLSAMAEDLLAERRHGRAVDSAGMSVEEFNNSVRMMIMDVSLMFPAVDISLSDHLLDTLNRRVRGTIPDTERVLLNLLTNACEAVLAAHVTAGKVVVSIESHQNGVLLCVDDNGTGMDESTLAKAGLVEFTTKSEGNGIGLVSVRHKVESWEGRFTIHSNPIGGTTVRIWVPFVGITKNNEMNVNA